MNLISILLILAVAAGFFAAIHCARKKGGCSCGGSCHCCSDKCGKKNCSLHEKK